MEYKKSNKRVFTYIRKKPLLVDNDKDICCVNSIHNLSIQIKRTKVDLQKEIQYKQFYADYIFDDQSSNENIFNIIVNEKLKEDSQNLIYFAYGQSGTGKTHTLLGSEGLIFKTCNQLISNYDIQFSSFQIYEDNIFDLYNNNKGRIYEKNNTIFVTNIKETNVTDNKQLLSILETNKNNRQQGISSHNNNSSRSHAVYKIKYKKNNKYFNIQFIDLAGTERSYNANINLINKNSYINMSLLSLKECIRGYINNNNHIPFRNNKLTLYLRDFFINNCCLMMISMISSESNHLIDTLDTLKYANYMQSISNFKKFQVKNPFKKINKLPFIKSNSNIISGIDISKYGRNIPILDSIFSEGNITKKIENKVMDKKKKMQNKLKKNKLLNDYISKRDKIIEEENDLFMEKTEIFNDKISFYSAVAKVLNKKIDCIEGFCFEIKSKYKE